MEDYLIIGSEYKSGMCTFGIRMQDLKESDPPVYCHTDIKSITEWKLESEKLSDFLLKILIEALACVDYQTAEKALEEKGWIYEEYFDIKKDNWVASKSVLKKYGIDFSQLKKYKADGGKVFCCYDEALSAFFVGSIQDGEISLSAINRKEAKNIFLSHDSLEFQLEELRLWVKNKEREEDMSAINIYVKKPNAEILLSDYCCPKISDENGKTLSFSTSKESLYILCSGDRFVEIIINAIKQNPKASDQELTDILNHCLDRETS